MTQAQWTTTLKVRLILYDKGKILLLRQTKANGGNYTLVGGTIEARETAIASLIREAREEAGIVLCPVDLELAHVLHKRTRHGHRLTLYFKAHRWEGRLRSRELDKFKKVCWFPLDSLPDKLTPTVRHVLLQYRKGHLYSEFVKK